MSSALASGDAGERTQVRQSRTKKSPQQHQQESPTDEKSGPTAGIKEQPLRERADLQLVRRALPTVGKVQDEDQDEVQDKDQDEAKFKMSVGMGVMHCADNTGDKNLPIMTVKWIGGRLNKIPETVLDVMCVFREEGQACAQEEGDVRGTNHSEHGVSVQARAVVQLIGWQNMWEQAPGVPATPSPP